MRVRTTKLPVGRGSDGRTRYFRVEVHPDAESMRKAIRERTEWLTKRGPRASRRGFGQSLALAFYFGGWWSKRNAVIGHVYFNRDTFGPGVVAHEMTHAAMAFVSPGPPPFTFTSDLDERLAMSVHRLVRGFWKWYQRENMETD